MNGKHVLGSEQTESVKMFRVKMFIFEQPQRKTVSRIWPLLVSSGSASIPPPQQRPYQCASSTEQISQGGKSKEARIFDKWLTMSFLLRKINGTVLKLLPNSPSYSSP